MYGKVRCAGCNKVFERTEPQEEAWIEAVLRFGGAILQEQSDEVCEECYNRILAEILARAEWSLYRSLDETTAEYCVRYAEETYWVRVEVTEGGYSGWIIYHPEEEIVSALTFEDFKRNAILTVARLAA